MIMRAVRSENRGSLPGCVWESCLRRWHQTGFRLHWAPCWGGGRAVDAGHLSPPSAEGIRGALPAREGRGAGGL
jgi:hypothetical protein